MALEWLSAADRDWATRNRDLLEACWEKYVGTGEWSDPVEIMRELRARTPNRRPNAALNEMPQSLGRREYAPPRLILTIFGLGCCPQAEDLLVQYVAVAQLAVSRFDSPNLSNRLTRSDVVAELDLAKDEADRLSELLRMDAPFLGGGSVEIQSWDRDIDPRVEDFEGITSAEAMLSFLATERRIAEMRTVPRYLDTGASSTPEATAEAVVQKHRRSTLIAVLGTAFAGLSVVIALLQWAPWSDDEGEGYRYFVTSTGQNSVLIPRIKPQSNAQMDTSTVLRSGDAVAVRCIETETAGAWAQLDSGSFVPVPFLEAEVGGGSAPRC